jgi:hypothetical protein
MQPAEAWLVICEVVSQLFREFHNARCLGAAVGPVSPSSIGTTWWYVLQTHHIMDEFAAVDIRRHHSIFPVFTSHLDLLWVVIKSTHATLVCQVKQIETLLSTFNATINKLNGARVYPGGQGGEGRGVA